MTATEKRRLEQAACKVRINALQAVHTARDGDLRAFLSSADLLTFLCGGGVKADSRDPQKSDRDRLVLTGGHCAPCLRTVLENLGSCPEDRAPALRGSRDCLGKGSARGINLYAGSLSVAAGMALAARYQERDCRVYALLGGEAAAAEDWGTFLLARHYRLDGLCVIIEQSVGSTGEGPLPEELRVLGFQVIEADGHDFASLEAAFAKARACKGAPSALLARTAPGKDIRFLESGRHGGVLDGREYERAMAELNAHLAELEAG